MTKRAAIILSGGRAERFQNTHQAWQDKALVKLLGKPLLAHVVENVKEVVEDIIVCVNTEERRKQYTEILKKSKIENVRLLIDEQCNRLGGPIAGILTGLIASNADYCFTLPSDMPFFKPEIIDHMFNSAENALVVVPMWPNGRLETLTMVLKKNEALEIAKTLCSLNRPRSDDIIRGALNVFLISTVSEIGALDPDFKSFVNINSQDDLANLLPRQAQGPINNSIRINLDDLPIPKLQSLQSASFLFNQEKFLEAAEAFSSCATQLEKEACYFWAAISHENEGKSLLGYSKLNRKQEITTEQAGKWKEALLKASIIYELEAKIFDKYKVIFLAERARSNKRWCESIINDQTGDLSNISHLQEN